MPRVGFDPMILVFERVKIILNSAATGIIWFTVSKFLATEPQDFQMRGDWRTSPLVVSQGSCPVRGDNLVALSVMSISPLHTFLKTKFCVFLKLCSYLFGDLKPFYSRFPRFFLFVCEILSLKGTSFSTFSLPTFSIVPSFPVVRGRSFHGAIYSKALIFDLQISPNTLLNIYLVCVYVCLEA
jgi:hypothetical protein